eukprot:2177339-Prymnesium_polylepis.1
MDPLGRTAAVARRDHILWRVVGEADTARAVRVLRAAKLVREMLSKHCTSCVRVRAPSQTFLRTPSGSFFVTRCENVFTGP